MDNFSVLQGSQFDFQVITDQPTAVSATLVLRDSDDAVYEFEEPFVNLIANFSDSEVTLLPIGTYEFQINENYADGLPDKFPDPDKCHGDCEFPTIRICEALDSDVGGSS